VPKREELEAERDKHLGSGLVRGSSSGLSKQILPEEKKAPRSLAESNTSSTFLLQLIMSGKREDGVLRKIRAQKKLKGEAESDLVKSKKDRRGVRSSAGILYEETCTCGKIRTEEAEKGNQMNLATCEGQSFGTEGGKRETI